MRTEERASEKKRMKTKYHHISIDEKAERDIECIKGGVRVYMCESVHVFECVYF